MQNPNSPLATEYKIRPVVRYLITRYEPFWSPDQGCAGSNSSQKFGEFESEDVADELTRLLNEGEAHRVDMVLNPPDHTAYMEVTSHGPESYKPYAEILMAIAEGKPVEWLTASGEWTYQHPSHTLNEIKCVIHQPDRYRIKAT